MKDSAFGIRGVREYPLLDVSAMTRLSRPEKVCAFRL